MFTAAARHGNADIISTLFSLGHLWPARALGGSHVGTDGAGKPLQPNLLASALQVLKEHAPRTREFQTMWLRAVVCVARIHDQMAVTSAATAASEHLFRFVMSVFDLVQLRTLCLSDDVLKCLIAMSTITTQFRDIHTELTFLERAMNHSGSGSAMGDAAATLDKADRVDEKESSSDENGADRIKEHKQSTD